MSWQSCGLKGLGIQPKAATEPTASQGILLGKASCCWHPDRALELILYNTAIWAVVQSAEGTNVNDFTECNATGNQIGKASAPFPMRTAWGKSQR